MVFSKHMRLEADRKDTLGHGRYSQYSEYNVQAHKQHDVERKDKISNLWEAIFVL
jgi:hypothetical protein